MCGLTLKHAQIDVGFAEERIAIPERDFQILIFIEEMQIELL